MADTRSFIIMAALALLIGQPAESSLSRANLDRIEKACHSLFTEMNGDNELQKEGQKAFNFVRDWIEERTLYFSVERKVVSAWEAVLKAECSSSWQNVVVLTKCLSNRQFNLLIEPLKVYANKCLNPVYVSKKVKSETGGMLSINGVSFINAQFINKYHQDNPSERPLHLNIIDDVKKRTTEECCRPDKSYGAVLMAMDEQKFDNKNKDPRKQLDAKIAKVNSYLNDKMFIPCHHYSSRLVGFANEVELASKYFVGGEEALLASLDQEAQNSLFRLKYCSQLGYLKGNVATQVAYLLMRPVKNNIPQ